MYICPGIDVMEAKIPPDYIFFKDLSNICKNVYTSRHLPPVGSLEGFTPPPPPLCAEMYIPNLCTCASPVHIGLGFPNDSPQQAEDTVPGYGIYSLQQYIAVLRRFRACTFLLVPGPRHVALHTYTINHQHTGRALAQGCRRSQAVRCGHSGGDIRRRRYCRRYEDFLCRRCISRRRNRTVRGRTWTVWNS